MATQYGAECWCSTEIEVDYERHGEGAECDHPCAGNEVRMCSKIIFGNISYCECWPRSSVWVTSKNLETREKLLIVYRFLGSSHFFTHPIPIDVCGRSAKGTFVIVYTVKPSILESTMETDDRA